MEGTEAELLATGQSRPDGYDKSTCLLFAIKAELPGKPWSLQVPLE